MNNWANEVEARNQILELVADYCEQFHNAPKGDGEKTYLPYAGRVYNQKEMTALVDTALDFWLTAGRYANEFEKRFAEYVGVKYCSLVNSGSSANLLAFMALTSPLIDKSRRVKRGDEVITVAAGFPTTVAPIVQFGAVPVFVDVTIPQYNIDINFLETALSKKTKAVFIAHTLGNPFDLGAVKAFCDRHDLWLVEDNCDALGSTYTVNGETCFTGTIGHIGTSSFYPPHHITMGEGGAVYTSDPLLYKIVSSLRDWGRDCVCPSGKDNLCGRRFNGQFGQLPFGYDHKYVYSHFGYNLKATEMQAAIGVAQLEKLPYFTEARRKNWNALKNALAPVSDKLILPESCANSNPSWFGFIMTCRNGVDRKKVVMELENKGIQTRALFAGNLTKQPCFDSLVRDIDYRIIGDLSQTNNVMESAFWVGVYPGLSDGDIKRIVAAITEAVKS